MQISDNALQRTFWRGALLLERVVGIAASRRAASLIMRGVSVRHSGYLRSLYRVATRTTIDRSGLTTIPRPWWSHNPKVRCRRLGLHLDLDLRDNLQRTLYFTGTYEPHVLAYIRRELRRGDYFIDVGAHVGLHALVAARRLRQLGAGRVIAFEPAPDAVQKLRGNARVNALDVEVVETALGDRTGTAELFGDPRYDFADLGIRSQFGKGAPVAVVPLTTFDEWASEPRLTRADIVKVDVEGAEAQVIRGMSGSLAALAPRVLIVEMKEVTRQRSGVGEEDLRALLADYGYRSTETMLDFNQVFVPVR